MRTVVSEIKEKFRGNEQTGESAEFARRHIGPSDADIDAMLAVVGVGSLEELVSRTVPAQIRLQRPLELPEPVSEHAVLQELKRTISKNRRYRSYLGLGFHDTVTPPVVLRNIMENPGWYTQYTPYQAEISQGRLEALLNFQTMVADLTGLPMANASLLDEGSAAAEAMTLCQRQMQGDRTKFFVSALLHPTTIEVLQTRAEPLGIELVVGDHETVALDADYFGGIVQYPASDGALVDYRAFTEAAHGCGALVVAACDLLALTIIAPPGAWGADIAVGNSQRFGVPLGFGGPHAAFLATTEAFRREIPGRIVGVSKDRAGKAAYRLALQTREQHIRRERATSNICTAQVLLAIMAGMYAVYHGPDGLKRIALRIHRLAQHLQAALESCGIACRHTDYFDTVRTEPLGDRLGDILKRAEVHQINLRSFSDGSLGISLDETTSEADLRDLLGVLTGNSSELTVTEARPLPKQFVREGAILTHEVFDRYHSETEMLRYIHRLQSRDLSLTTSMIPLGSCTMKLNATVEMIPVTWPEFGGMHPFAPASQTAGYREMITELENMLAEITGMSAVSLQPNAGSQGEYAGLLAIRGYHQARGEAARTVCLIPLSAHGTNPASAVLAGMRVVGVKCDEQGNVDLDDLRAKAASHAPELAALMVTYPSTHGVFEESIQEICSVIHQHGGQVYMDGANMNAQVGLCRPGDFGVDVCHLNLHKTFCIPHGGGGPGVGPVAVRPHLAPYLPGHRLMGLGGEGAVGPVASAPFGSASILPIPWVYIRLMGARGLQRATEVAILNANYIAKRLEDHFPVLYRGKEGFVAHECILDLRRFKRSCGVEVADVAKRLMDYGFHAPTVSFPVVETLMVEPTESESKAELDRFCDALIAVREEIREIEQGLADSADNLLKNAPHTADAVTADTWEHSYSRERAAYPLAYLREHKYWPPVGRIDNAYGDRNFFCTCIPMEQLAS
ncbi:MAG: aminomethyl-transferring glycine dehydrogenase [Bdellovibrionales bacterium]|nr:aminomethyl-transferring glycine dehydrogenase [Bdellovibrionales bacterium]